jgi:hypothetical protein
MKGGTSGNNESNLDKGNILKPTFDTLMEEGRKAFKSYLVDLEELFHMRSICIALVTCMPTSLVLGLRVPC